MGPGMTTHCDLNGWRAEFAATIAGDDPAIVTALDTVRHIRNSDCGVLIGGESGTGKELFARAVHASSQRRARPFVAVNCAAIPESLLEAELFGHVRGAFTGASVARTGRVASAHGGTLFLDEIGDLPLAGQGKLLRMLQDRTICPVGSDVDVPVDVRVVAATNRDLEAMVAEGTFRADLFYRLCLIVIHLPPVRERGDDVDLLADELLRESNRRNRRHVTGFDASARKALRLHRWPGNVRELAHTVERAVLLTANDVLTASDLRIKASTSPSAAMPAVAFTHEGLSTAQPPIAATTPVWTGPSGGSELDLRVAIEQVERTMIDQALARSGGNRTEAAALLGLNRTTLVEKLRKYAR
jgi:transcriptional regulator with GAF, ATPase, and Fis domain